MTYLPPKSAPPVNRRAFLGGAAALGAGRLHPPWGGRMARAASADFAPNAFIRIGEDGHITLIMRDVEMGQGIWTGASMLMARGNSMSALDQITPDFAPPNEKLYSSPLLGTQATGGSTSIRGDWEGLRKAAAIARAVLVQAAAQQWKVDPASCSVTRGVVTHKDSNRSAPLWLAGRRGADAARAAGRAAQGPQGLVADRHAAEAARHPQQGSTARSSTASTSSCRT
ncbi:MAG: molybdopterin cofactor-binding domain-containing protein [Aliidongia sp.]